MMAKKGFWPVLLCWLTLQAFNASANSPVLLPNAAFDYAITPYVSVLEDPSGQLDITTMLSQEQQLRFTPSHSRSLKFGITDSAYWLRFSLTNPYGQARHVVVTLSGKELDTVEFYDISAGDDYIHIRPDNAARSLRGSFIQAHPVELTIPPQSTRSYLIRLHSSGLLSTHIHLLSMDRFVANEQEIFTLQGISTGWILATLAWFIFIFLRRRLIFAASAAAYCITIVIYQPAWMGLYPLLLNIEPATANTTGEIALAVSAIFHTLSVRALSWRGKRHVALRRFLLILALFHIPATALVYTLYPQGALLIITLLATLNLFSLALVLALGHSDDPRAQHWLLTGALIVGFSVLLAILTSYNLLSLDLFTDWAPMLLPFVVVGSLVLALMNIIRLPATRPQHQTEEHMLPASLLSQISHELRTPINGVIGMNELLSDTPLSASQRDFSDTITLASRDLLHVANEVSDLARMRNGTLDLDLRPFNLSLLLNQVLSHFQQEAIRKQVELVMDIAEELPEQFLGDSSRLQTLLHNLIGHALAYTEHGELTLHAGRFRNGQSGGLLIQLQLSSTIVKPEELKQAFHILQHHAALSDSHTQAPWNLLVTRYLMEKMDAGLAVESMTGQGASLTLTLPLQPAETVSSGPGDESLIGLRILIVDDNASLRAVIEKQTRRWGMRPDSTYSGREALAMLRNQINLGQPYDVIIIDHVMPVMNGLQLAERIQQDADIQPKPARLMLTGLNISAVREEAQSAGIQQLLAKPASGERLRHALLELRFRRPAGSSQRSELSQP